MGFWDFLRGGTPNEEGVNYAAFYPRVETFGNVDELVTTLVQDIRGQSPAQMWATQPHLRTVVSFLARNIAQVNCHVFDLVGENDRARNRTSSLSRTLLKPNEDMTRYELFFALVGDKALHDRAYWHVSQDAESASGWTIRRLPPAWVDPVARDAFGNKGFNVTNPQGKREYFPASEVLEFPGFHPTNPRKCSPTLDALKDVLQEQIEAAKYRGQVWKKGGRVSSVLERPADAPEWSDEARKQFREDWYAKYTGNGPMAGGTPLLEDGMKLNRIDFSAADMQFVEAAKLGFSTVASSFHVNPTMVGILDNANFSNVREFRRMLYGDTLGPWFSEFEDRINAFLLPMMRMDSTLSYAEFNIGEKMQGSFEEQAAVISTSVGRPWMTADEARGRFNMPALGGDAEQLVTPLNVLVGGQASPRDSAPPKSGRKSQPAFFDTKDTVPEPMSEQAERVLKAYFSRQERVVRTALGAKAADEWWDDERWDRELSDDLYRLSWLVSSEVGPETAKALGFTEDDYDVGRTYAFLRAVADRMAGSINAATKALLDEALASDDVPAALDSAFATTKGQRSGAAAAAAVAGAAGFAACEAATQTTGDGVATKTWLTGRNARPSHRRMDGESVKVGDRFSNGAMWPGDAALGADEMAGCNCRLAITVGED